MIGEKNYLRTGIENIFDIHYREFASGISAPGQKFNFRSWNEL